MGSSAGTRRHSWDILALTRFLLALVVLVGHLHDVQTGPVGWTAIGRYLNQGSAVYGFLLISGYSIAASLEREETGFLRRRFWRIYPAYLASIALAAMAALATGAPLSLASLIAMLFMLQSVVMPTMAVDGQLWTLAVEWWNYALAPAYRRIPAIGTALLAVLSAGMFLSRPAPENPALTSGGLMFAMLSWLWLIGFMYHRRRRTLAGYALLLAPLLVVANLHWLGRAVWIGVAGLVLCDYVPLRASVGEVFRWLGDLSYPIYAVHVPVYLLCLHWGMSSPSAIAAVVMVTSAVILWGVERPLRAWGLAIDASPTVQHPVSAAG